jgi:hypothetical protein
MSRSGWILLAVAGLALLLANPFQDSVRVNNPEPETLFGGAAVLEADRVEIRDAGAPAVLLTRGPEGWTVASRDDFPADTAAVGTILRAVAAARSTGPVSTNPANRSKFQVDSTGVAVRISRGGEPLAAFTVGKSGSDFTTSYVLPEEGEAVHVVRGLNRNLFARPKGFRDASVLRFDPARVTELTLSGANGGWTLTRADSGWARSREGEAPTPAAAAAVEDLLRNLGRLDADDFAAVRDTVDAGLDRPETAITVRFDDGTDAELWIGRDNGRNQRYAVRPGRRELYLLGQWRVDRLVRDYEDLAG